jgi:hypothetical protein
VAWSLLGVEVGYDYGTLTSNPLRGRVHNDIHTVVNGTRKVSSRTKCVVHNDRDSSFMCNRHNLLKVWNIVLWVADALKL